MCAVARALDGKYEETYMTIAETGKRNEILMLLAMKRNNEALMQLSQLPNSEGLTHYLKAICLNRMDKPTEAYEELKEALEKDPSLKATAKVDADVNNLLPKDEKLNN
jgi:tetratricopeptide (TPR) repeat protein